jgi:hypothetical protein
MIEFSTPAQPGLPPTPRPPDPSVPPPGPERPPAEPDPAPPVPDLPLPEPADDPQLCSRTAAVPSLVLNSGTSRR